MKNIFMKMIFGLLFAFLSLSSLGQKNQWIPFYWEGDSASNRYFNKAFISIPITIDNLPYKFKMQLDFGAPQTEIYGNSIKPFRKEYDELKDKIDTTLTYWMNHKKYYMFKDVNFKLGEVSIGKINIIHHTDYGDSIPKKTINTKSEITIGTIGTDIFQGKIVIIDYPKNRICITSKLPNRYAKANFQPFITDDGRIKIPFEIDNNPVNLLFDTGSSIFSLVTSKENAEAISEKTPIDSLEVSSSVSSIRIIGLKTNKQVKFGDKVLKPTTVYYEITDMFNDFFNREKIWGLTGNAYFWDDIVIIDYKNKQFGIKYTAHNQVGCQ